MDKWCRQVPESSLHSLQTKKRVRVQLLARTGLRSADENSGTIQQEATNQPMSTKKGLSEAEKCTRMSEIFLSVIRTLKAK
jgi:hypothetical protein